MNFYSLKHGEMQICFRSEALLTEKEDVIKFAKDSGLLEDASLPFEAQKVCETDYIEYLMKKLHAILTQEFEAYKESLKKCSIDEICKKCDAISGRQYALDILEKTEPEMFRYLGLEPCIELPEALVADICDCMDFRDNSSEMLYLKDLISDGPKNV